MEPMRVGIIGCGVISSKYLENSQKFPEFTIVAVADLLRERAEAQAAEYGVPRALSVEELLADDEVETIINLTIPAAHAEIALATLRAGKHTYGEKPLATNRDDAASMLQTAAERNLLVGCAPDTFLGAGLQTARGVIDQGLIGLPVAATAFMLQRGPERWHRDPEFFYQPGGGPLLDMAPYYLTALINLFGPIRRVTGFGRASYPTRTVETGPKKGEAIRVNVQTHTAAVLEFVSGPLATLVMSFDVWPGQTPKLEVYGSEGTLALPDPNTFGGPLSFSSVGSTDWEEVALTHGSGDNSRGLGVADLAVGARNGEPHRASGDLAAHALDAMLSILDATERGQAAELTTTCERPAPLPSGLPDWTVKA